MRKFIALGSLLGLLFSGCRLDQQPPPENPAQIIQPEPTPVVPQAVYSPTPATTPPAAESTSYEPGSAIAADSAPSQPKVLQNPRLPPTKTVKKVGRDSSMRVQKPVPASPPGFSTPMTTEEAKAYSQALWNSARRCFAENNDSSSLYTQMALRVYENGSLFCLKAKLQLLDGDFTGALTAAERSLALADHWDSEDRFKAFDLRSKALDTLYSLYPSEPTRLKAVNAKTLSRLYSHE